MAKANVLKTGRTKLPKGEGKEELMSLRARPDILDKFQAATFMRGTNMSTALHEHMVRVIREEEVRDPEELGRLAKMFRAKRERRRKARI